MRRAAAVIVVLGLLVPGCTGTAIETTVAPSTSTMVPTTTTSSTMTSTSTTTSTTTTLLDPFTADPMQVTGLGPACNPEACAVGEVAVWPLAGYSWTGRPGVLGLLRADSHLAGYEFPEGSRLAYVGGLIRAIEQRPVTEGAWAEACRIAPEFERFSCLEGPWMLSVYFGDNPTTGQPVVGQFYLRLFFPSLLDAPYRDMLFADVTTHCDQGAGSWWNGSLPLEVLLNGGDYDGCSFRGIQPGWAYDMYVYDRKDYVAPSYSYSDCLEDSYCAEHFTEQEYEALLRFSDSVDAYNTALVAQMSGEDAPMPRSHGVLWGIWNLTGSPVVAPPGLTVVVGADCPLCDQVITALRAAGPDLPLRQIDLGSDEALILKAEEAPTVFVFDRFSAMYGDPWTGQAVLDDLDGFLEQVCVALAHAPDSCR